VCEEREKKQPRKSSTKTIGLLAKDTGRNGFGGKKRDYGRKRFLGGRGGLEQLEGAIEDKSSIIQSGGEKVGTTGNPICVSGGGRCQGGNGGAGYRKTKGILKRRNGNCFGAQALVSGWKIEGGGGVWGERILSKSRDTRNYSPFEQGET